MKNFEILKNVLTLLQPYKMRMYIAAIALLTVVFSMLTIGYFIKNFIDTELGTNNKTMEFVIIVVLLFGAASFVRSYLINSTAELAANDAKRAALRQVLQMEASSIEEYNISDLSSRINQDSEYISRVIIDTTSYFIRNMMTTIGGIILMFMNSFKLSLISFSIIAIVTFVATKLSKKVKQLAKDAESSRAIVNNLVLETIINNKIISCFTAQDRIISYFEKLNNDTKSKIIKRLKFRSLFFASVITAMLVTLLGIIWYGSSEVYNGNISAGILASFLFYSFMTAVSFGGIVEMSGELEKNLVHCERLFEIKKNFHSSTKKKSISLPREGTLELKNLSYSYKKDEEEYVINDLSLSFTLGKFNVITGKSGSGKTTILNILIGSYRPNSGSIIIDGEEHQYIDPALWKNRISYVPQDNMLFSGNIVENISFFSEKPDLNKIENLIEGLDLKELIESFGNGYNRNLGSISSKISGGQRQRIAIARALYPDPEFLILDEATSQLDEKTERKVLEFIKNSLKGKTIICVAHRRGAIEKAEKLIEI